MQTKSLSPMTLCLWPQRTIDCCLPCHSHLSMKACYVIVSYKFSEYYITELMFIVEAPGIIDCYAISAISIVAFLPCCIMNLALCSRAFLVKERKTCMIYDHTAPVSYTSYHIIHRLIKLCLETFILLFLPFILEGCSSLWML